ncbi:MAG: DNRLRE domain-containing protein [Candidatus Eisenbacteria bacterium]|uniref:DNRLRE domain-containing protein n=1 Tax=Eiseniibacteriota bacterium TaxID=2212470 RepID=A0A948RZT3_UNCEI|nr:DNRLRE domain-containing protein [Candidatus Eisenbacteria bacterium]MBU1950582.1 DNRLRE domain-containing protein [Candidatus Eisenbacteria bacterium]MBU2692609.1 DNRLRE domain-containing protein [Candidatus Eisenbacteria bacterium]
MSKATTLLMLVMLLPVLIVGCSEETNVAEPQQVLDPGNGSALPMETLPDGAILESATLYIYAVEANHHTINAHQITTPWDEMTVTWNNFGGGFAPEVVSSFVADAADWHSVDLTPLVQSWLDGTAENHGVLLDQATMEFPFAKFRSTDYFYNNPYMEICYLVDDLLECMIIPVLGDTYIWEYMPDENYGGNNALYTGWYNENYLEKQTLIKFDLEIQECGECEGGVNELTLRYLGSSEDHVIIYAGDKPDMSMMLFKGIVQPNEDITFAGIGDMGTMGPKINIWVNERFHVKIHTSCSEPIGPGLLRGNFRILAGRSRLGGPLCPLDLPFDKDEAIFYAPHYAVKGGR